MLTPLKIEVGDIIVSEGGKAVVLAKIGDIFARSKWYEYDKFGAWLTLAEAKGYGFKIMRGTKVPMTLQELASYMGHDIEIVE